MLQEEELFDSHFHIIDDRYPLVSNNGYMPENFTHKDYLSRLSKYKLVGGAIVSGSFQAFDQGYLLAALKALGPSFVGVTQLPYDTSDARILELHSAGVRALRFNLYRGGSETLAHMATMAKRVHELVGWHIELYIDPSDLQSIFKIVACLPAVSIDHLGLKKSGFPCLLKLAEKGVKIKATGFGRIDFNASEAIKAFYSANPNSLMFGTDLPSTRAPRPYQDSDFAIVLETLDNDGAKKVLKENAMAFYKPAID